VVELTASGLGCCRRRWLKGRTPRAVFYDWVLRGRWDQRPRRVLLAVFLLAAAKAETDNRCHDEQPSLLYCHPVAEEGGKLPRCQGANTA